MRFFVSERFSALRSPLSALRFLLNMNYLKFNWNISFVKSLKYCLYLKFYPLKAAVCQNACSFGD
jgi:hypothetical protein